MYAMYATLLYVLHLVETVTSAVACFENSDSEVGPEVDVLMSICHGLSILISTLSDDTRMSATVMTTYSLEEFSTFRSDRSDGALTSMSRLMFSQTMLPLLMKLNEECRRRICIPSSFIDTEEYNLFRYRLLHGVKVVIDIGCRGEPNSTCMY